MPKKVGDVCDILMEVAAMGWRKPESFCRAGRKEETAEPADGNELEVKNTERIGGK